MITWSLENIRNWLEQLVCGDEIVIDGADNLNYVKGLLIVSTQTQPTAQFNRV
jgi:hypothetical protein